MDQEDSDIPGFGEIMFDHFVAAEWDPDSTLSKNDQARVLVERWIRLGKRGRAQCRDLQQDLSNIAPEIPRDLLSASDRAEAAFSSVFWIRTWFGGKNDKASQEAADAAYRRLYVWALLDTKEDGD